MLQEISNILITLTIKGTCYCYKIIKYLTPYFRILCRILVHKTYISHTYKLDIDKYHPSFFKIQLVKVQISKPQD